MECNSCGSKWESKTEVTKCPFCGCSLQTEIKPENMGISDAIAQMIELRGPEALKNTKLVSSFVMDYVREHEHEKKLFRVLCNYDILSGAYKILITTDPAQREVIIRRQYRILIEDAFLPEQIAAEALNLALKGIGVKAPPIYSPTVNTSTATNTSTAVNTTASKSVLPPVTAPKADNTQSRNPPVKPANAASTRTGSYKPVNSINTFEKYLKALEDYYVALGKQPLTEPQIRQFLKVNSLDRIWGVTVSDVQKDLNTVYAKFTPVKPVPTVGNTLFTPNLRITSYKTYLNELEQVFLRNGKKPLTEAQIKDFIGVYSLKKNYGITVWEVEQDLRDIMRKY